MYGHYCDNGGTERVRILVCILNAIQSMEVTNTSPALTLMEQGIAERVPTKIRDVVACRGVKE